jgi:MYXO-CTERM domain-containing protein
VTQPQSGISTHTGATVTYTPTAGFLGDDVFTYTVFDGQGGTATGTVSVSVRSPPPALTVADATAGAQQPTTSTDGGGCSSSGSGAASLLLVLGMMAALRRLRRRAEAAMR